MLRVPQSVNGLVMNTELLPQSTSWNVSQLLSRDNQRSGMRDLLPRGESTMSWDCNSVYQCLLGPALGSYMLARRRKFALLPNNLDSVGCN